MNQKKKREQARRNEAYQEQQREIEIENRKASAEKAISEKFIRDFCQKAQGTWYPDNFCTEHKKKGSGKLVVDSSDSGFKITSSVDIVDYTTDMFVKTEQWKMQMDSNDYEIRRDEYNNPVLILKGKFVFDGQVGLFSGDHCWNSDVVLVKYDNTENHIHVYFPRGSTMVAIEKNQDLIDTDFMRVGN